MNTHPLRAIYQIKVTLRYVKPPVWRRFLMASSDTLEELHCVLQAGMGWTSSHLHEFVSGRDRYGVPDEDFPDDIHDESGYLLGQVLKKEKDTLLYVYDFGDGWEHEVLLEKIKPFDTELVLPHCLDGAGACPPEDVGGPPGYEHFLEAITDSAHPEHDELIGWSGGDFDSSRFDVALTNDLLHKTCH